MTILELCILTAMEAVAWMLLLLKILNARIKDYLGALAIFFPIYIFIINLRIWIPEHIATILFYIAFVMFIQIAFRKKLTMAIFIGVYATFLMLFWQFVCTGILRIFVPNMEFVFTNGVIVMSMFIIAAILSYL